MLRIISYYITIDTYMESFKLDRQLIIDAALILLGSFLLATGYSLFLAPAHISPGGVYGLALVIRQLLHQVFHVDLGLGTIALFFNIPLFLLAMHGLGKMSAIKTVVTFLLVALFSDLIDDWFGGRPLVEDAILCSFYGGAILGVSVWMIFRAQSTCAGTDTLARVLSRTFNTKVSTLIMLIDSIVVLLGLWVFEDWRVPLYSWIAIFIYSKVVEALQPQNPHKSVFIISDKAEELRDVLVGRMGVRGTFLHGRGMYTGAEREVLFIIIQRKNLQPLKKIVLELDPRAFITTADASNDTTPILL
mgnify:FL=1